MLTAGYGSTAGYQFDYGFVNPIYAYNIDNPYLNGMGENKAGSITARASCRSTT